MGNSTEFDVNAVAHVISIPVALFGLVSYITSLYLIHKSERYHNVFGVLCIAYVSFHIQTVSVLFLWTIVRIIEQVLPIYIPWKIFMSLTSPIGNSTVYAAIWIQFVLAINRFWAISYPLAYHRIFNPRNARITVISLWSFSMLITALYYNVECVEYFEADTYSWSTLYGPCNHPFIAYIAMVLSDGIIVITLIVNAIAFYRIMTYLREKKRQKLNSTQESLRQDIFFFKETCVTTVTHAFLVAIFHFNGNFVTRVVKITYVWLAMSTSDGFIFVFFNRNLMMDQNSANKRSTTSNLTLMTLMKRTR